MSAQKQLFNNGSPVVTSTWSALDLVSRMWGPEWRAPDHNIYLWNNGRGFDSSDQSRGGIYGITEASSLVLPGANGDFVMAPNAPTSALTGDIQVIAYINPVSWTPSNAGMILSKWNNVGNTRSYRFFLTTTGALQATTSMTGTAATSTDATSTVTITGAGGRWVKWTRQANDGAGHHIDNFYTSAQSPLTPVSQVVWAQLGATVTTAGVTGIFQGTADLEVGTNNEGTGNMFKGNIEAAYLYGGINGPLVASMVPADTYSGAPGWTSVLTGEQWTLNGNASVQ